MDLVPTLSAGLLIQLWRQLQVGGWEESPGGDFSRGRSGGRGFIDQGALDAGAWSPETNRLEVRRAQVSVYVCLPGPHPVLICSDFCAMASGGRGRKGKERPFWSRMEDYSLSLGFALSPFS